MDNRFTFEADFPTGTKVLVYDGEDADGNIRTFAHTLRRTTHLMPPNYYLGRRIQGFDLSRIFDNNERARIENERRLAWRRRPYDNNNVDPVAVPARMDDNDIPLGRNLAVPMGGSPGFRPAQRTPQALAPLSDNARFEQYQADRDAERADNVRLIREERMLRRRLNGLGRRVYDNNNPDPNAPPPVQMDDVVPMGRVLVPQGGRKSRRGRKSKKSRKRRSRRRGRR